MRAILGALLIAACAGGAAAATPRSADFKNWTTACDGAGGCSAWAWGESWASPGYVVLNIDPDGRRTLLLGTGGYPDQPRKETVQLRAEIVGDNGHVLWSKTFASRSLYPATVEGRLDQPSDIDAVIGALTDGKAVHFDVVGETTQLPSVSLDGSAAALLWVAEHRKDAPAAPIIRRASKVPQTGLPSPAPASVRRCETGAQDQSPPFGYRLAPGKLLWISECGGGGYNRGADLTVTDEHGRILPGPTFDTSNGMDPVDGDPSYDPKTRTFSSVFYANGTRTCGTANQWIWDGQEFRYSRSAAAENCEGLREADWPVTYRARVVDR